MDHEKRRQLEEAGWRIGSASDFLELCDTENSLVAAKLSVDANRSERAGGDS